MLKISNSNFRSLIFLFFFSFSIHADELALGQPSHGGTGCPYGSADISLDSDGQSLRVFFNEFSWCLLAIVFDLASEYQGKPRDPTRGTYQFC